MTAKVIKSTTRGQITLPKAWREQFRTDNFLLQIHEKQIIIQPVRIDQLEAEEKVIFDADRDNDGKGVTPDEIIRLLKKIQNE